MVTPKMYKKLTLSCRYKIIKTKQIFFFFFFCIKVVDIVCTNMVTDSLSDHLYKTINIKTEVKKLALFGVTACHYSIVLPNMFVKVYNRIKIDAVLALN